MYSKIFTLIIALIGTSFSTIAQPVLWQDVQIHSQTKNENGNRLVFKPNNARAVTLNVGEMKKILWKAQDKQLGFGSVIVEMPKQYGGFEEFEVSQETNIFADNLFPKYGQTIRAFSGKKVGDPSTTIRMTLGYGMYNAVTYRPDGNMDYVEYAADVKNNTFYVYRRGDVDIEKIACHFEDNVETTLELQKTLSPTQQTLYRIQLTTSGSFSQQFGDGSPTIGEMQAVITGQLNNILNPVYNRDFGVILQNATIDESIFLTAGANTPFSDETNSIIVLYENSVFCNVGQTSSFANIDINAYDVGHAQVFANSGGVAGFQSVCSTDTETAPPMGMGGGSVAGQVGLIKAGAMSGTDYPLLNDFTIDYLAHELGHQFGCNHTYATVEGPTDGCNTGVATARYEVGSGTTIMGYANVCSSVDVYPDGKIRSDPFFHSHSIDQAVAFVSGSGCGNTATGAVNAADPVATPEAVTMSIPRSTPFVLVGTVTDDGSSSVAAWNQYDLAANDYDGGNLSTMTPTQNGPPLATNTTGPLFRFQVPTTPATGNKVTRIFPSNAQSGGTQPWEVLPSVARTMVFRLTARDNQIGTGNFGRTASNTTTVTVTADGPMAVTTPTTNLDVPKGSATTVTFTGLPSGICSNIDIFLSTDGGATYSTTALATNVANTGTHSVTIPSGAATTSDARILVQCHTSSGELFGNCTVFQISPSFNITAALPVELTNIWAKGLEKANQISWTTASEINNEGFEVQRSADSKTWETLGFVNGQGTSNVQNNYEWIDERPLTGVNYYRLMQRDFDGQFDYSKIVEVNRNEGTTLFDIRPNPNNGQFQVDLPTFDFEKENATFELYDLNGRLLFSQPLTTRNEAINPNGLANGVYFARLVFQNQVVTQKLTIQQ